MKKIMISLLMVAATLNAMAAISYTGKAKLTLTSSDSKSCTLTIGESADFSDGLNDGYYAEINTEGKEVQLYVIYGGVHYQQFASNAATMQNLPIGAVTNGSTTYTMTASSVVGTLKIMFNGVEYTIDAAGTVFSDVTLPANSALPAVGDEDKYRVQPAAAPLTKEICFNYNVLKLTKYNGAKVTVYEADGATVAVAEQAITSDAATDIDLSALAQGRYVVKIDLDDDTVIDEEYQIDVKPAVTAVP